MNSVILSPNFPPNFTLFTLRLKEAGANVLGIGDEPWHELEPVLKECLTEYYRVSDLHNYEELVRAMGHFIHRYGLIDHIDSHNEYWLETEARLRTDFHIKGINFDQIETVKRKSLMKEVYRQAGLKPARGLVCLCADEARSFIDEVGYPVVAKPDIGVGASATFKILNEEQLAQFWQEKLPLPYIFEEFIAGQIVTFDGLVDARGELIFASSLRYSKGVMEAVNEDSDVYYYVYRSLEADLEAVGKAVLKAFDVRARFFHFEFFRLSDGSLVPLEVNMRPPGGFSLDMFNYAFDFDAYELWAQMLMGRAEVINQKAKYFVLYVGAKEHIAYKLARRQVHERFASMLLASEKINSIFARALGHHGYILRWQELPRLLEAAAAIQERL
jgi:hypothetical protein